jgi:hypothetical protein
MKQYNYKPRSNSTSSQDGSAAGSPPKDDKSTAQNAAAASGPTAAAVNGRRRVCLHLVSPQIMPSPTQPNKCPNPQIETCETLAKQIPSYSHQPPRSSRACQHTSEPAATTRWRRRSRASPRCRPARRACWAACGTLSPRVPSRACYSTGSVAGITWTARPGYLTGMRRDLGVGEISASVG